MINSSKFMNIPQYLQVLIQYLSNTMNSEILSITNDVLITWSGDLEEGIRLGAGNTESESYNSYMNQKVLHFMMYYQERPPLISPIDSELDNRKPGQEYPWVSVYYPQEGLRKSSYLTDKEKEDIFCGITYDLTQERICKYPNYPLTMN